MSKIITDGYLYNKTGVELGYPRTRALTKDMLSNYYSDTYRITVTGDYANNQLVKEVDVEVTEKIVWAHVRNLVEYTFEYTYYVGAAYWSEINEKQKALRDPSPYSSIEFRFGSTVPTGRYFKIVGYNSGKLYWWMSSTESIPSSNKWKWFEGMCKDDTPNWDPEQGITALFEIQESSLDEKPEISEGGSGTTGR